MQSYRDILKKYWGFDDFRGIQEEIIKSITDGHDTLGLMPTGGGKSITFQVPALSMMGTCIVVTPLIALMKDQVSHLRQKGIRAEAIHSDLQHDDILRIMENAIFGAVKLLYVSPERLSSDLFRTKIRHMKVSFICVDEAHCISQWGYDFRPSYLRIAEIRDYFPNVPVLALTATATPRVVDDIQQQLHFRAPCVFRMSFERKNLAYIVRYATDKTDQLIHILKSVQGSAIVYARSRQRTKEIAIQLNEAGLQATFFHAGLDITEKDARQNDWQQDKTRIMVATNAFGMGIDKPDVRIVVHMDCPSSIEAYFQEAGRAGRDGKKSYAVLLHNNDDARKLRKRVSDSFPPKDFIRNVYDCLAYFFEIGIGSGYNSVFEFSIDRFCRAYKMFPIQVDAALRTLDRAGYIEYMPNPESQARLMFIVERDELYRLRGNTSVEDQLIIALLRNYSGLFNDYVYIDESFLAQQMGLSVPVVYDTLKRLSQKNIVRFIPQKQIPMIRYVQRREDSCHLQFPPQTYDTLLEQANEHIDAMTAYFSNNDVCRSRQLLNHFGETHSHDCQQCDVCLERSKRKDEEIADAQKAITESINDHKEHDIKELYDVPKPLETIESALNEITSEEELNNNEGAISV